MTMVMRVVTHLMFDRRAQAALAVLAALAAGILLRSGEVVDAKIYGTR
jgi:hypothetical protein